MSLEGEPAPSSQRRKLDISGSFASTRCYCPVPGCPAADHARSAGWQSVTTMRGHLEPHVNGRLAGSIPEDFLALHSLGQCVACSRLLSKRFGNACPRCRPFVGVSPEPVEGRPLPDGSSSLHEVFNSRAPVKTHIPKGARRLWSQCVVAALASFERFNDVRAWTELLALPRSVLRAEIRGGR